MYSLKLVNRRSVSDAPYAPDACAESRGPVQYPIALHVPPVCISSYSIAFYSLHRYRVYQVYMYV